MVRLEPPAQAQGTGLSSPQDAPARWQVWADTGGTFTDCLGLDPRGELHRVKVLSNSSVRGRVATQPSSDRIEVRLPWRLPDDFFAGCSLGASEGPASKDRIAVSGFDAERSTLSLARSIGDLPAGARVEILCPCQAPVLGAHLLTGTGLAEALPPLSMRLATTRGTNALLERQGARTVLFVTSGFADLLRIGNQQRPDLFALAVEKPAPLYAAVVEVDERLAADGGVLWPLDTAGLEGEARRLLADGVETAAVSLLHSYRNPVHEEELAGRLLELGFRHVSTSASLARRIRYLPRAETALVNAYLSRAVADYLEEVTAGIRGAPLMTMTSAGGVVRARSFRPKDSLLSGPAGGVVGAATAGRASGEERLLAFDMGGTSTDVSRFDGDFDYRYETRVGGVRLLAPSLAIETVAAGGGSICAFDGTQLKVGPASAGAAPGPACYGFGGPLTLTDVNLLLGRLEALRFEIPIDPAAASAVAEHLHSGLAARGAGLAREELLEGFLRIADERMADAVRRISVREGFRPSRFCLVAFGGAGGQHACAIAELLEILRVLVPTDAGLLSAYGLGAARVERFAERQVLLPLAEVEVSVDTWLNELANEALERVRAEGIEPELATVRFRRASLRLAGQETVLEIEAGEERDLRQEFAREYRRRYGYPAPDRAIEVESLRVVASGAGAALHDRGIVTESGPAAANR